MKLTIIETGLPPKPLQQNWPRYPAMFQTLLDAAGSGFEYETVPIANGATLPDPSGLKGVLITGSAAGVYDDEPWMQPLFAFIRAAAKVKTPQFGICFGHQAMAEALGGRAEKSDKGWGVGRHTYKVSDRPDWMADIPDMFSLAVSHQDQVTTVPARTTTIATSDFCLHAGLHYQAFPAASFQGHPEFEPDYASALHELRRDRIGGARVDEALASFADPIDSAAIGVAMARFFHQHST